MRHITYGNIVSVIQEDFPELMNSAEYYDESMTDLPYIVLGDLCQMAFSNIDEKQDISLAEKLVQFTDKVLNDPNSEEKLINLFAVEVLENLTASVTGAKLAKRLLHDKSLELLDQTLKHNYTEEFLREFRKGS